MKYEEWSLGYWFLKKYISLADWLIHKKTLITGKEKIPENKPIVFAPNHQNGLSDPMAVLLNTRFQPVWLGRADLFGKSKLVDIILRFLKIMPVYRLRDGKENLEKNEKTFANSIKVLENNFALALFPEAAHSARQQMLIHKKAVPRIVFMAEEKSGNMLDIQIIPTGIYYSSYWKFNRTVIVNFGDPIPAKDYLEQYHENPNLATIALKTKIHKSILPLIINFKTKRFYNEFESIRNIYGPHFLRKQNWKFSPLNRFKSDQVLANKLDNLETEKPKETEQIAKEAGSLFSKIKSLKLRSWLIDVTPRQHVAKIISTIPVLILGLPVFLYGFIFNALPFFIIDKSVRRKVKDFSFWSTFFLGAGIIVFPILYLLELLAMSWIIPGIWMKILFLVSLPLTGKLAFKWFIMFRKTIGMFRYLWLKKFNPKIYHQLLKEKQSLTKKLDSLL
jgi:1-acyl-sn-glycerol-3-phosphate acyltransferase